MQDGTRVEQLHMTLTQPSPTQPTSYPVVPTHLDGSVNHSDFSRRTTTSRDKCPWFALGKPRDRGCQQEKENGRDAHGEVWLLRRLNVKAKVKKEYICTAVYT